MDTSENTTQLNMDLSARGDVLAERLQKGQFSILFEYDTPPAKQPFDSAMAPGISMAKAAESSNMVAAVLVTQRARVESLHDAVEASGKLAEAGDMPAVLTVPGRGMDFKHFREVSAAAVSRGVRNLVCVTGDLPVQENKHSRSAEQRKGEVFLDGVDMLAVLQQGQYKLNAGAAVNPYKYNAVDQYLQYYKMMRKTATGADFLITNAGWDMKKLQDLQWYLQMREAAVPVLARLPLLTTEQIRSMYTRFVPGVHISRSLVAMMQRESEVSDAQSLSAQLHRLGLQAAGCRLLGYSGVVLTGVRDKRTLEMALQRVNDASSEYPDYRSWVQAWQEHHGDMNFSPIRQGYYTFRNLMTPDQCMHEPEASRLTAQSLPRASRTLRCRSAVLKACHHPRMPRWLRQTGRRLLCGLCKDKTQCRLAYCEYLCPRACPKNLVLGACGGSRPDGSCENGEHICFFHNVLAVADTRHELDSLEEGVKG